MTEDWYADPALAQRVADGWVPFGFHVAYQGIRWLEFDGVGDDGLPIWERLPRPSSTACKNPRPRKAGGSG